MRILVTGASGFTGRHFVERAQMRGYECISLDSDLRDYENVHLKINQLDFDFVAHLAAISFVGHNDLSAFYSVNVIGTENLLRALAQKNKRPVKVIIASSANVYGNTEASPIIEDQPFAPINHYAYSKVISEFVANQYKNDFPIIITRPFNYTGVDQDTRFVIPKIVAAFAEGQKILRLGNLDVRREFNDVRFVVSAYLDLLENQSTNSMVLNICSGNAFSLSDVITKLTTLTGKELEIVVDPNLVRKNEISALFGDPTRLNAVLKNQVSLSLDDTLREMLRGYGNN